MGRCGRAMRSSAMSSTPPPPADRPSVEQLAHLYDDHHRATSHAQRVANRLTATLGRPATVVGIVGAVLGWTAGNVIAGRIGSKALEQFPFPDLGFVATIAALLTALLILTTQRHQDELAEKRARLTLQIAALSEKKIAKLIALMEEQRHDNPLLPERIDRAAAEMAKPVDPSSELEPR